MRITIETDDGIRYGAAFTDTADPAEVGEMVRVTIENITSRDPDLVDVLGENPE